MLLFSSLRGIDRRKNINCFLDSYYASFCEVFSSAGEEVPFTRSELQDEYNRMYTYGITMGLMSIPIAMKSEDIPDFQDGPEHSKEVDDMIAPQREQFVFSFKNNRSFRSRVMDMLNDIVLTNKSSIYD